MLDMASIGAERQLLQFEIATSALLGMRSWIRQATGGTATVVSEFIEVRPLQDAPPRGRNGVLVANTAGLATPVDLAKASRMGTIFIPSGLEVYPGMIFGETTDVMDIDTNISRKHDGYQKAGSCPPPQEKLLEQALTYIEDGENLEVTPKRVVMRKAILDASERRAAIKAASKTKVETGRR